MLPATLPLPLSQRAADPVTTPAPDTLPLPPTPHPSPTPPTDPVPPDISDPPAPGLLPPVGDPGRP